MAAITDFEEFLSNVDNDIDEIHSLYESASTRMTHGGFHVSTKEGKIFIKDMSGETLMLASETAVQAFLKVLDHKYGGDFNSVHSLYNFTKAMEKDD